jgi:hypothetical protein
MAKIVTFPRTLVFTQPFEKMPLFTERTRNGDLFCAGLVDGVIEVSVTPGGDWWISDLHIAVENARRTDDGATGELVRLDPDESCCWPMASRWIRWLGWWFRGMPSCNGGASTSAVG